MNVGQLELQLQESQDRFAKLQVRILFKALIFEIYCSLTIWCAIYLLNFLLG